MDNKIAATSVAATPTAPGVGMETMMLSPTTTFVLELVDYRQRFKDITFGVCEESPVFTFGGYQWQLKFYPDGRNEGCAGNISVELCLVTPLAPPIDIEKCYLTLPKVIRSLSNLEDKAASMKELRKLKSIRGKERYLLPENKPVITKFRVTMLDKSTGDQIACCDEVQHTFSRMQLQNWCCLKFAEKSKLDSLSRTGPGCFTIQCVFSLYEKKSLPSLEDCLKDDIARLYTDMECPDTDCSDITIVIGGQEFRAHKAILVATSPVFKKLIAGPTVKKDLSRLELPDEDPQLFQWLLRYMYTRVFPPGLDVYKLPMLSDLASRYDMPGLEEVCDAEILKKSAEDPRYAELSKDSPWFPTDALRTSSVLTFNSPTNPSTAQMAKKISGDASPEFADSQKCKKPRMNN